jgi:required for meiotic nuclear division protein 1
MECLSFCIADQIDLTRLDVFLKQTYPDFHISRYRDVLKFKFSSQKSILIYIFKNGTVVSWGIQRYRIQPYLNQFGKFALHPLAIQVHDEFSYHLGDSTKIAPHGYYDVDCLTIDKDIDDEDVRLSLSYGFAQSVKLQYFETLQENLIEKYTPFINNLSHKGELFLSRNSMRQIIGEILIAKSEMNLISNFLYHPKFFWRHPSLEEYYTLLERYLHIQRRVNAINHRLDTLNEIFDMFNSYLENRHSTSLELIIIALIAIEIIFGVLNFHF